MNQSVPLQPRLTSPRPVPSANESNSPATSDLAKYLVRRELVSSGLLTFDDKPENYWAWKASFLNATAGLYLSPKEELDLLCKWLGPKSSDQAKRLRAVHTYDAAAGVKMVWQRLEDIYGSPEAIENALLKKLEDFPKIANRENGKLRELGDLISELDAARVDGFLPGLSYLDTSRGITPIVQKLPFHLQEKWITTASYYKEQHHASYPPFPVFVKFVCDKAKTLNDPSFAPLLSTSGPSVCRPERMIKPNFKTAVSVRKTEILAPKGNRESSDQKVVDPDKLCPLHNKPHSLRKCRGFRAKTLDQRKVILKQLAICYKCCSSVNHMAKDCDASVHCNECKSDQHVTALHPGPPPWKTETPGSESPNVHGGEQAESPIRAIVSKCTEVCGKDEQSNRSLAKTEFFEIFNVNTDTKIYTLKTCSGVGETKARQADGFILESLDGNTSVRLPTLIECNMLPDDRSEIPTPEAARQHAHLKHLAVKIPDLDPNGSILVLLGRDIPRVHKVREHYNGPHDAPYAQRLDLGWVIIGDVCLGGAHVPSNLSVFRTSVLNNGRTSLLDSCTNSFHVKRKDSEL
ncbi:hypothetical protein F2P79_024382 [Pimephales promelas]|nr:hypothetical protein F2P79_024382 [Pimephales promelas]